MSYPYRRRIVVSNHGLSYIRIKKVASTSITSALTDGKEILSDKVLPGDLSFAVLRDPIERFIAAWYHHKGPSQPLEVQMSLSEFLDTMPEGVKGFGMEDGHLTEQRWFLEGHRIDTIFTLDQLPYMWTVLQGLHPTLPDLPHYNNSGVELTCTPEERERIKALYA